MNWEPIGPAVTTPLDSIWAPELTQHNDTYYLYFITNRHIVTIYTSPDGDTWTKYGVQMEVSGYHHNVAYDFRALRPALYASGTGAVRFSNFKYSPLP